ncbi:MAG: hypothetical protein ABSA96_14315 [Candidatus Acidiferrales bacterium]
MRGQIPGERKRKLEDGDKKLRQRQGITSHDLRRSAVRNMIGVGVSEIVTMKVTTQDARRV